MDMAEAEDVTSAFALNTHLFGSTSVSVSSSGPEAVIASATPSHNVNKHERDFSVPLGEEGVDEVAIEQLRLEKAKRGCEDFYRIQASSGMTTSLFAVHHHSPSELPGKENDEGEDGEVDMSIVLDSRRTSNVFAQAFRLKVADKEQVEKSAEFAGLYPSLDHLKSDDDSTSDNIKTAATISSNPTLGAAGLAFLDDEEEDDRDLLTPPPQASSIVPKNDLPPKSPEKYLPLPDPVFVPRTARLSVVPESQLEGAVEEGDEEEEDDATRDIDETAGFGSMVQPAQQRRLSIAHPTPAGASPAVSYIMGRSASPVKGRPSSPIKSSLKRRQSLAAVATFTGHAEQSSSLSRSVPASASLTPKSPRRAAGRVPSPLKPSSTTIQPVAERAGSTTDTGLTPAMRRLGSWAPLPTAASSEPVFDEAAPMESEPEPEPHDAHPAGQLTLDHFLHLTSVQFMDDMGPAMARRRKSMMSASTRRAELECAEEGAGPKQTEVTLADQVQASAAVLPFMDMYRMVSLDSACRRVCVM